MNQELLNKYIAGDATPEEKEEVARWLDTDKKNMKEFLALRKLYDISMRLCQNAGTTFFYAQSPDFHKPGLCYYPKFLYL